jgi:hypothetical protein
VAGQIRGNLERVGVQQRDCSIRFPDRQPSAVPADFYAVDEGSDVN